MTTLNAAFSTAPTQRYSGINEAIADMHDRGYTHDLALYGNGLLLVQLQRHICGDEFSIREFHYITGHNTEMIVFGVSVDAHAVHGIIIMHLTTGAQQRVPKITGRLKPMMEAAMARMERTEFRAAG